MVDDDPLLVLCTAPDEATGARLAGGLVEGKLAACVNLVLNLRSFYVWKGALHDDAEVQLLIKTRRSRYPALEAWLLEHHPYEVPEVVACRIEAGSADYLAWVAAQT